MRLWIALLLVGCASDGSSDRICAACEPERIGDTGDLGGVQTWCWANRVPEEVDAARAHELGFDVDAMENAIARPIDMPLVWHAYDDLAKASGEPATGYSRDTTTVTVRVQSLRTYRHMRPNPALCDGITCRDNGVVIGPQADCARTLETDVRVEASTGDGAVRASLTGFAMQVIPGNENAAADWMKWPGIVSAAARLNDVEGTLRLNPRRNGIAYRALLRLLMYCGPRETSGELTPQVFIWDSEGTGADYWPLAGSFPPFSEGGPQLDAGAPR